DSQLTAICAVIPAVSAICVVRSADPLALGGVAHMNRISLATSCAVLLTAGLASAQTTVSGRVTNARGGVIANADVTLHLLPPPGQPAMPPMPNMPGMAADKTTTTGADGSFSFTQVAAGQYAIMADSSGFERASQELTVGAQPPAALTLALSPLKVPGAEPTAAA